MSLTIASRKPERSYPSPTPSGTSDLRVSRLDDLAKGLVVDDDVDLNDLGDSAEIKDNASGAEPNTGYSILTPSDARNHERPNHLRLFRKGSESRSFRDRNEDPEQIAYVRDMERRNRQPREQARARRNKRTGTDETF
jgi:hypothetical protein